MAKGTGKKGSWQYSGISGLTVGKSNLMKTVEKKYPKLATDKPKVKTPTKGKTERGRATMPVIRNKAK